MDDSQIHVPESFLALFQAGPGRRLREPWPFILGRYDVCEDLAQGLLPQSRALAAELGVTAADIGHKFAHTLQHPSVGLAPEEVQWVTTRLMELIEHPV